MFDKDNDELLSVPETLKALNALGKHMTKKQLQGLSKISFRNKKNEHFTRKKTYISILDSLAPYTTSVDFPEFLTLMAQEVGVDDEEDMKTAIGGIFDFFDTDRRGYISSSQLR